jgi:hypothetical protein
MIVLLQFDLDDKIVDEISAQDTHAEDIIDQINDAAIAEDNLHGVWHLGDNQVEAVNKVLGKLWLDSQEKK